MLERSKVDLDPESRDACVGKTISIGGPGNAFLKNLTKEGIHFVGLNDKS